MNRRGIALVAALALLSLLGLLVAGAVAAALVAQRTSRLVVTDATLAADVDYAIGVVLGAPATYGLADLRLGEPQVSEIPPASADGVRLTVTATLLPSNLLWLVALASADEGARRVSVIARFPVAGPVPVSPIIARSTISLANDVSITADTGTAPPPLQTSDPTILFQTTRQLAALDSIPGVLHVHGDTTITAGSFTGLLVVDGNLRMEGPFSLTGALIAGGRVDLASATIRFSPCTVARLLRAAAPPRPVRGRTWAELF